MDNHISYGVPQVENVQSFISNLHLSISNGFPHAEPVFSFKTDEGKLVQGILQMLQGHCSSLFYWDEQRQRFFIKDGIYVLHLSYTSLYSILSRFLFAGTCLKQVELYVQKVQSIHVRVPTLNAFANSITSWLKRLRDVALKEEVNYVSSDAGPTATLLGITNSLSSLCAGAEVLLQVVYGAIPVTYLQTSIPASELTVQILNHLFKKLNELCLVQGGKEEAYHMLLFLFTESLLPYLEGLDSWLYDGILDDPFEEMFFYANDGVAIDQPAFWEMSYLLREGRWRKLISNHGLGTENVSNGKSRRKMSDQEPISVSTTAGGREHPDIDDVACPVFLKDMAKAIVSAGKSLQLVRHVQDENILLSYDSKVSGCCKTSKGLEMSPQTSDCQGHPKITRSDMVEDKNVNCDYTDEQSIFHFHETNHTRVMGFLTLPEIFLVSMVGLLGDNDQTYKYLRMSSPKIYQICEPFLLKCNIGQGIQDGEHTAPTCGKTWQKFLADVVYRRGHRDINREDCADCKTSFSVSSFDSIGTEKAAELHRENWQDNEAVSLLGKTILNSLCPGNPVITFDEREHVRRQDDERTLETLFAFPTLLPCSQLESSAISELLPFQKNSTLASRILKWIQSNKVKDTLQPAVIIQESLAVYIREQVDHVGKHMLLRLMNDWKLLDELGVLQAIYLLGSGDLLQQFLIVTFNKLDRGDIWDDEFELNTMLQESIRNSADGALLSAPDALVVSVTKHGDDNEETETGNGSTPRNARNHCFGINALDILKFTYKVSWPLDLIANVEALKKYNQVMGFLLKVKRAKFVLDKARRWMWKGRGSSTHNYKHHLLVEQKLLHFVDAFHQYVMDRVLHSAWSELCNGMASAGSLDEVIEVHDTYLLSIQRQCFVASDKLWALIASRLKTILGLALDFYAIQQTLSSGGAAAAIKARCEMEVDRIEKQFDDCVAFLLRILSFKLNVGHFPHLADLVTRINYNYFYMSDSGNLQTVPSFGTAAKLG
ncbi:hypothetical protein OPV22_003208 [Ensete ventricosum]|uniref:Gamma-tubulin complex component n=1 Tax=Ensete ventricosum TaxID=4639 RepID=A0AAV8S085_ENSVE|nr:hypothetical protein OPV22_003208 [Ensete ventricosum]